jgi:hypothetical protein
MIKTKIFNNIENEPVFKRDDIKIFQWLGTKPDPLNPGKVLMPVMAIVPNTDRVYISEKDDYIDIAAIKTTGAEGKEIFHEIIFRKENEGKLLLRGNRTGDREIYQFLYLSNFNKSNPDRDTQVKALYELVNPSEAAKEKRKSRSMRREAMNVAAELSGAEVREFIASLGKDETRDLSVLRDELESF